MEYREQIDLLLNDSNKKFVIIKELFNISVRQKKLDNEVLIIIKQYLENLKTVLDYTAKKVFLKFCTSPKNIKVYFPILRKGASDLEISNTINHTFPNLNIENPFLYQYFFDIQPQKDVNNEWLQKLNDLCNLNKHNELSIQERKDDIINILTYSNGQTILWTDGLVKFNDDGNITIGSGATFSMSASASYMINGDSFTDNSAWIVDKLFNYKCRTMPNLDGIDSKYYKLDSYLIASFHFKNDLQSAVTVLDGFLRGVNKIVTDFDSEF